MRRHGKSSRAARAQSPHRQDILSPIQAFVAETNPARPMRPSPLGASTIRGMPLDLVDRIRQFPFFSSAPDAFLVAIGSHLRLQVYSPQENILTEGDDAKAMYWLVRGAVMVTSRDRESIFFELQPGSFFGEIGIMMDIPRTASIVARYKSIVMRLNKEDLQKELPKFPEVERAIREEAAERLAILERKKQNQKFEPPIEEPVNQTRWSRKRSRDLLETEISMVDGLVQEESDSSSNKRRKSPSPALVEVAASSALSSGQINVRQLLRELPLFADLPDDILHFLGLNAQPASFAPFTKIIQQGSTGRDVYFITDGEVEVYTTDPNGAVKARLRTGSYFGEVTSLSLAPKRTANVRSVTSIECLIISGDVLDELWRRCSPNLRRQVEKTARERLSRNKEGDVIMSEPSSNTFDMDDLALEDIDPATKVETNNSAPPQPNGVESQAQGAGRGWQPGKLEPFDPDPFPTVERIPRRPATGRRGSLPNTPTDGSPLADGETAAKPTSIKFSVTESGRNTPIRRPEPISRQGSEYGKGRVPNAILLRIFDYLSLADIFRLRRTSVHWSKLISTSPQLFHHLDLSKYNRRITDSVLTEVICPVVGQRPRLLNINNCFHISDEGFNALANHCASNLKTLKMKSVWDISPQAVVEMANKARDLEEIDFSNCRKVSDNLLSRVIGWVVRRSQGTTHPPEGTVIGCPSLSRLTLSYCKHVSDRFMAHLAFHASERLEQMDLTRCTTITDMGFRQWGESSFPRLRKLILADCTYLTDHAIIALVRTAKALEDLDLSFCCALSDTSVEAISSGCSKLLSLNLAFCGSAVSDSSMQSIAMSLSSLRSLSVRGCVRVTGAGVEAILAGCTDLNHFDVSQCRNLKPWLDAGGVRRSEGRVKFCVVAEPKRWIGQGGPGGVVKGVGKNEQTVVEVRG